jgi:hypothetical protein
VASTVGGMFTTHTYIDADRGNNLYRGDKSLPSLAYLRRNQNTVDKMDTTEQWNKHRAKIELTDLGMLKGPRFLLLKLKL